MESKRRSKDSDENYKAKRMKYDSRGNELISSMLGDLSENSENYDDAEKEIEQKGAYIQEQTPPPDTDSAMTESPDTIIVDTGGILQDIKDNK